jgi:hypothetical protein
MLVSLLSTPSVVGTSLGSLLNSSQLVARISATKSQASLVRCSFSSCGNALELQSKAGRILALSKCAYDALTDEQITLLSQSVTLLPLEVSAIELAGGSVRCMLAGIHLSKR